jgi:hypothetical protein
MLAERRNNMGPQGGRTLTMVAVYDGEEAANALLDRLAALRINLGEATLVRVAVNDRSRRARSLTHLLPVGEDSATATRYAATGAAIGGLIAMLCGLALSYLNFLNLSFLEGLLAHTLAMVLLGVVLGAALGALIATSQPEPLPVPSPESDGYLVLIRTPRHLAAQAETIARQLGAKQIIL